MQATSGFCAMALTAAGLLFMPAANAQDKSPAAPSPTAPGPTAPGKTTAPTTIPDTKLDAAAAVIKRVSVVQQTFEQKSAQAPPAEKARLAEEANNAMAKVVADQGLSMEEYTNIITVAQNDPIVRTKLLQRLK